ncbi:MAG: hypothetical protein IJ491_07065 [Clostridia bacterium]|nr:hypothetical protein [Clostridia bacterium]
MTINAVLPATAEGKDELESHFSKIQAEIIADRINGRDDLSRSEKIRVFNMVMEKLADRS